MNFIICSWNAFQLWKSFEILQRFPLIMKATYTYSKISLHQRDKQRKTFVEHKLKKHYFLFFLMRTHLATYLEITMIVSFLYKQARRVIDAFMHVSNFTMANGSWNCSCEDKNPCENSSSVERGKRNRGKSFPLCQSFPFYPPLTLRHFSRFVRTLKKLDELQREIDLVTWELAYKPKPDTWQRSYTELFYTSCPQRAWKIRRHLFSVSKP